MYKENVLPRIKNNVFKNILWLSFDKIFRLVLGLVAGIWMARYLGPDRWGELNYIQAYISILSSISLLGMDGFLVKEILEQPKKKRFILGSAFFLRSSAAISGSLITYLVLLSLHVNSEGLKLYFFLLPIVLLTPFDLIDIEYQSQLRSKFTVLSKSIAFVMGVITKIVLILMKMPLIYFAAAVGSEVILAYSLLVIQYQITDNNIFKWSINWSLIKNLIKRAWPFTISSLMIIMYMRLDQIMLGTMINEKEVGQFSAAVRVTELFLFLPMAVASSALPGLLKTRQEEGREAYLVKMQNLCNYMFLIALLLALGVTVFSHLIIKILYGNAYAESAGILIIHVWSLVGTFMGVSGSNFLVVEGLQKYSLYRTIIGLIVNVSLNIVLIPVIGGYGAALATMVSQIVVAYLAPFFFKPTRELSTITIRSFLYPVTMLMKLKEFQRHNKTAK